MRDEIAKEVEFTRGEIDALAGALLATFTVTPVLAALVLPKKIEETETIIVRTLRASYTPLLRWARGPARRNGLHSHRPRRWAAPRSPIFCPLPCSTTPAVGMRFRDAPTDPATFWD